MSSHLTAAAPPGAASGRPSLRRPVAAAALAGAAVLLVAALDPNEPGHYPTCPFLATTGLFCPGCGSLRAVHALTRGDLPAAVSRNVLTVVLIPALVGLWLAWTLRTLRDRPAPRVAAGAWWALLAISLAFAVLRNTPWGAPLAP